MGYCIEMIWAFAGRGYWESRQGVIYGPFIPVYAFGALLLTLCLYKFKNARSPVIFLVSAIIGGGFEFICSWFQEAALGTISWEYSDLPFNLHGRTNLLYSLLFGVLGLLFVRSIYPFFSGLVEKIPNNIGKTLTWILITLLIFDFAISAAAVRRRSDRNHGVQASNSFEEFLDEHYDDDYLNKVFPNMVIV